MADGGKDISAKPTEEVSVQELFGLETPMKVRAFAEAADRLGVDVDAERLPETGSAELRHAARAFNTMADRMGRLLADRGQMVAAISHDLRTMLTRLRLRSELIDDPVQRDKAFADLDQMTQMVNASLAFARDDAKRETRTPLDLARLLQSLVDDHADAGAEARYEGPESVVIRGQPTGLRRVFDNLIGNALAYAGDVTVRLTAPTGRHPQQAVTVEVIDHGPGIPADRREDVFATFVRLEGSRSRDTGGTGLGLAVARGIVRAHGGDITLTDTPGGGLTGAITLPTTTTATMRL
jgi:signal transduction histidine kinase